MKQMLLNARVEALFVSPAVTGTALDRDAAEALIRKSIRTYHVKGCAELVAGDFGDQPMHACIRMTWALATVRKAYDQRCVCARVTVRKTLVGAGR